MADFICAEIDHRSGSGGPFLPLAVTAAAAALSLTRIAARKASASMASVPGPAVPGPDLVIGQADLLLGDLEALLDGPAPSGDAGESGQARVRRAEDDVIGELVRLAWMATDQQPVIPGRLLQAHQAYPRPIVDPLAFGAGTRREALPCLFRYSCRQCGGGVLARPVIERRP